MKISTQIIIGTDEQEMLLEMPRGTLTLRGRSWSCSFVSPRFHVERVEIYGNPNRAIRHAWLVWQQELEQTKGGKISNGNPTV